jgi:uncharacterized protein YjbI with pentapeptide repeats
MADARALQILLMGTEAWNQWRAENPSSSPDLRGAGLQRANLTGADFSGCDLREADLGRSDLNQTNLIGADLRSAVLEGAFIGAANLRDARLDNAAARNAYLMRANLSNASLTSADLERASLQESNLANANLRNSNLLGADLERANLSKADLSGACLNRANLTEASLNEANLRGAHLESAELVDTDLTGADLTGCRVYGVSARGLKLENAKQRDLIITPDNEPEITADNIEVAQFIYFILNNQNVRGVIDTITSRAVLILGRFTAERKIVLDALRDELRKRNYLPILFDFDVPATRSITETVSLLAHMVRFIIADLTDPSSIPQELEAIVPHLAKPVQPLLEGASRPYAMFRDYRTYDWVLPIYRYEGLEPLLATLAEKVIAPAEAKVKALEERRRRIEAELLKPQVP